LNYRQLNLIIEGIYPLNTEAASSKWSYLEKYRTRNGFDVNDHQNVDDDQEEDDRSLFSNHS
jgi:hypothetical protein